MIVIPFINKFGINYHFNFNIKDKEKSKNRLNKCRRRQNLSNLSFLLDKKNYISQTGPDWSSNYGPKTGPETGPRTVLPGPIQP